MRETTHCLIQKTTSDLDKLCENLKILPGQRAKFNKMIRELNSTPAEYGQNNSIYKEKPQKSEIDNQNEEALSLCNVNGSIGGNIDVKNTKSKQELEEAMSKIKELESQLNKSESPKVKRTSKKVGKVEFKKEI